MKRLAQLGLLGLIGSLGLISVFVGCDKREKKFTRQVESDLTEIRQRVVRIEQLAPLTMVPDFQLIDVGVTLDNAYVILGTGKDRVHLSQKMVHQIVWLSRIPLDADIAIRFKDANPFSKNAPTCGLFANMRFCSSGPIRSDYAIEKQKCTSPDPTDSYCFNYEVCVVLPNNGGKPCTRDPGIIIHP